MTLAEFKYNDVIHRCFRCGYCKFPVDWSSVTNCPAYARYRMESYSSGGRLWLIRAWLNEEIPWSDNLAKILYACTTCKNCVEKCPHNFSDDIVDMIRAARSEMVEQGKLPKTVKSFLNHIQLHGNPYGISKKKRGDWINGFPVQPYNGQEYLFYVGCEGSFNDRAQQAAVSVARVLESAGISFGVLGKDEISDGNDVDMMGEEGLFEELAEKNIQQFAELGVKKIVTLSPHSYNTFLNRYPAFGGEFKVQHYTHLFQDLIRQGKLNPPKQAGVKAVFHDPCFLGRWNKDYETPRKVIKAMEGIDLVEMERNRAGALCCGGGSGNFFTDFLGGSPESPSRIRVREALDTGADILATACPGCLVMLEDAVKDEGAEQKLAVKDISELFIEDL